MSAPAVHDALVTVLQGADASAGPELLGPGALPLAVWREEIWPLLEDEERSALRASCKAACTLCDQLIHLLSLQGRCSDDTTSLAQRFAARLARNLEFLGIYAHSQPLEPWLAAAAGADGDAGNPYGMLTCLTVRGTSYDGAATCGGTLRSLLQRLPCLRKARFTFPGVLPAGLAEGLVACCQRLELMSLSLQGGLHGRPPPAVYHQLLTSLEPCLRALPSLSHLAVLSCQFEIAAHVSSSHVDGDLVLALRCLEAAATISSLRWLSWDAPWTWAGIPPLTQLTTLELLTLPYGADSWPSHSSLVNCTALVSLDIPHVQLDTRLWVDVLAKLPLLERLSAQPGGLQGPLPPLERLKHLRCKGGEFNHTAGALLATSSLPSLKCLEAKLCITLPGDDTRTLAAHWELLVQLDGALQPLADGCRLDLKAEVQDPAILALYMHASAAEEHAAHHRFRCVGRSHTIVIAGYWRGSEALLRMLSHSFAVAKRVWLIGTGFQWVDGGAERWLPRLAQPWCEEVQLLLCIGLEVAAAHEAARQLARMRGKEETTAFALVGCVNGVGHALPECRERYGGVELVVCPA